MKITMNPYRNHKTGDQVIVKISNEWCPVDFHSTHGRDIKVWDPLHYKPPKVIIIPIEKTSKYKMVLK